MLALVVRLFLPVINRVAKILKKILVLKTNSIVNIKETIQETLAMSNTLDCVGVQLTL